MERSTVTGKTQWSVVSDRWSDKTETTDEYEITNPKSKIESGFSILELMIAMFILIILLSVALPAYQRTVQHARETVLKENLWQMRRAIDQFRADKQKLPQSVKELKDEKYLQDIPVDPIEEKAEWTEVPGEDDLSPDGGQGMIDVKSTSQATDGEGKQYAEY